LYNRKHKHIHIQKAKVKDNILGSPSRTNESRASGDVPVRVRKGIVRIRTKRASIAAVVQVAKQQHQQNIFIFCSSFGAPSTDRINCIYST